ncbi:MAG: zinc ribbon domain-containing protein, partial [Nitrospira sp.]
MESIEAQTEVCPKCRADRSEDETECASCGIIFAKYRPLPVRLSDALAGARAEPAGSESSWRVTAKQWLIETDTTTDSGTFYGRLVVFLGLLWWGRVFIMTPLETNYTGESFLHLINLPFHEAGHLIFSPFGRFMMILGGSLGQVLMPLI